ncbi:ribonuclease H-like domain-containing protein [Tanacetum coccineum]
MVLDAPPATPTSTYDKVFQANAIKLLVHLDADKLNYSNWSELFKNHLEVEWLEETRGLDIGDLTVDAYFRKIDAIASRLSNLGSNVTDEYLVTYAINGLSEKYDHVAHIMLTREPFSDLETVRSMGSPNNRIHDASATFSSRGTSGNNTGSHSRTGGLSQGQLLNAYSQLLQAHQTLLAEAQQAQQRNNNNRGSAGTRTKTGNVGQAQHSLGQQLQAHVGSSSTNNLAQETTLPQAFNTLTLQDFGNEGGNMDTGAGDLYPVTKPTTYPQAFITSQHMWHQRLGYSGSEVLWSLISSNSILYNKTKSFVLCHACQLGKHMKLLFASSDFIVHSPFDIVHSDLWTSPVPSISGIKYYVLFLDHFSHYIWVYPLRHKSHTFSKFAQFRSFIKTQFKVEIRAFQCDHGGEFDNHTLHRLFDKHGIHIRFSYDDEPTIRPSSSTNTVEPTIIEPIQPTPIEPDSTEPTTNISPESPTHVVAAPILAEAHQIPSTTTPQNPTSTYSMVTRSRAGVTKPNPKYHCHVSTISPIPKSYNAAFTDPNWQSAMLDEYNALIKNRTWTLVPRPPNTNIVRSMWLFKHKYFAYGSVSRYKARLVANGHSQQIGVDCDETFSPVVKPATIRTVLSLAASRHWHVHQLDVKNAFLHGHILETVYMHQPPGFYDPQHLDHGSDSAYLLIYVDDIILTASSTTLLQRIISSLHQEFSMTDLGPLNYFLGISVSRDDTSMFLHQRQYALEVLKRADGVSVSDPTLYKSLAGSLQYLTFTRPNLSYAVQQICLYMHDPREPHLAALKRILRYVRGTLDYGLQLYFSSSGSLVGYIDANWAGCPTTRRSTSGYCVFLGNNLLSWSSKHQVTLSRSSAEAEYRGVANVVAETAWLRNLLRELHSPLKSATLVYCDNVSAVYLSSNPVQHQRTKHIEIDIHFIHDQVAAGCVRVLRVPSRYQFADIFTKGLAYALFDDFRPSLNVRPPPAPTAGGC